MRQPEDPRLDVQIKSLSSLGWFLSLGTFGQLFAALVVVYKLVINPWKGAVTEVVHNGMHPDHRFQPKGLGI